MAKGNVAAEPSMEEILASIRRIIADEEPAAPPKSSDFISKPLPDESVAAPAEDVLDLAAEEDTIETIPAKPVTPVDVDDVAFGAFEKEISAKPAKNDWNESVNKPAQSAYQPPQQQYQAPQPAYQPPPRAMAPNGLISAHTESAANAAFNSLASAIFSSESRTIEDLTKELLRPMLKQWLDDNLASMVERIVRDEIERVARGRR